MLGNGVLNSNMEPVARWECPEEDHELDATVLGERLRFPYASNVVAPNRIMKSAMSEQLATFDKDDMKKSGIPTRELINLYEKFADGGFGTIVTGCIMVNGKDIEAPGNVIIDKELDSEERRAAFQEWTECTKRNGSIFIAQLFHPGKRAADLPGKTNFDINKLTRKQFGELINEYAYAASYAQQCGFNGVEISSAYFFALGELLTSGANTRTDEFGGELNNRAKILFKIIQAIRMKISQPSRFVIGLKLFCGNFEPDFKDDVFGEFVHNVEKTGFDYITITGGHYNLIKDLKRTDDPKKCEYFYQQFVLGMKNHLTRTKLFMNGGFVTLPDMVAAVRDGWAAGISLGRPVAAEPDLPKRMFAGEVKSAAKSLFDPLDYSVAVQFAGSQLWQHGYLIIVMDPSNPDHVEQFKKDLHFHEKQKSAHDGGDLVIGYPKTIVHPELLDKELLEKIQHLPTETITHAEPGTTIEDVQNELTEEETHHVTKKQLDSAAPGDLQENTVENTVHTVVKRHENLDDGGGVEIIEETIEKVTHTQADFSEPSAAHEYVEPTEGTDAVKSDGIVSDVTEAVDSGFHDAKSALESAFDKGTELVDEVVKGVAEGLRKEDEEAKAATVHEQALSPTAHEEGHHEETLSATAHEEGHPEEASSTTIHEEGHPEEKSLPTAHVEGHPEETSPTACEEKHPEETSSPTKESESKETTGEVISGLSGDDKPIISGLVGDVVHGVENVLHAAETAIDDIIKPPEHAEHEREYEEHAENQEHPMTESEEHFEKNHEELPVGGEHKVDENVVEEVMQKEIYGDTEGEMKTPGTELPTEPSPEKHEEQFTDASEFRDAEGDHEMPAGEQGGQIPEEASGIHKTEVITDDQLNKDDSLPGDIMPKDKTPDDHVPEDHVTEHFKDEHPEDHLAESGVDRPGLDESLGDAGQYKVSSTTYSTLFGSSLPGENGSTIVYEEHYEKHSIPGQPPEESYHSDVYEVPSDELKDIAGTEHHSGEQVYLRQVEPVIHPEESITHSGASGEKAEGHGLAGLISSALPDSVQNLISSTKGKFGEMFSEGDGKQQPVMQFTERTEEMVGDDGGKYEVHTESYTVTDAGDGLHSDFGNVEGGLTGVLGKADDDLAGDSEADVHHSSKTTVTTTTVSSGGKKKPKKHRGELFGDKKSTDELDFEFIH